jgi:hypothetical protein
MFAALVPGMVVLASAWAPSVFPSRAWTLGSSVGKVRDVVRHARPRPCNTSPGTPQAPKPYLRAPSYFERHHAFDTQLGEDDDTANKQHGANS